MSVFGLVGPTLAFLGVTVIAGASEWTPRLESYLEQRLGESEQIDTERAQQLDKLANFIARQHAASDPTRLTFICTHNSRRSHFAQLWAAAAAQYYGFDNVETFSGGMEATAMNPRAVDALRRAGLLIAELDGTSNPRYEVRFAEQGHPSVCFSKVYDEAPNPRRSFCAVMTCSDADRSCPMVRGAAERIAIPYEDPKSADGTLFEAETYDLRCEQIAREMLHVFRRAKELAGQGLIKIE